MSLWLVPGQTLTEPVTVGAVKSRLKLTSTADDVQITGICTQAREFAERICKRGLVYGSYSYTLDRFPYPHEPMRIPAPPLIALTSITYYDGTLAEQTLDPSEYWVAAAQIPALLAPAPGVVWPPTARVPGAVTVNFNGGYGYQGAPAVTVGSTTPAIPPGPSLPLSWLANLVDIAVFMYENAGVAVPETLVQIPKVYLF